MKRIANDDNTISPTVCKTEGRNTRRTSRIVRSLVFVVACVGVVSSTVVRSYADESPVRTNSGVAIQQKAPVEPKAEGDAFIIRRPSDQVGENAGGVKSERETGGIPGLGRADAASMAWPLLVVLGLIFFAALAVRKFMPRGMRASGGSAINILARQHLSSKQSLCLVQVGRRVVLVGVTGEQMSALSEITDREELADLTVKLARSAPSSFSATLEKLGGAEDDAVDDEPELELPRRSDLTNAVRGRQTKAAEPSNGATDQRVRDLVSRIRALSVGSSDS